MKKARRQNSTYPPRRSSEAKIGGSVVKSSFVDLSKFLLG